MLLWRVMRLLLCSVFIPCVSLWLIFLCRVVVLLWRVAMLLWLRSLTLRRARRRLFGKRRARCVVWGRLLLVLVRGVRMRLFVIVLTLRLLVLRLWWMVRLLLIILTRTLSRCRTRRLCRLWMWLKRRSMSSTLLTRVTMNRTRVMSRLLLAFGMGLKMSCWSLRLLERLLRLVV